MTIYRADRDAEPPDGARHRAAQPPADQKTATGQDAAREPRNPARESAPTRQAAVEQVRALEERARAVDHVRALEERARRAEERARVAMLELRTLEQRLVEARTLELRLNEARAQEARPAIAARNDRAAAAREHELARMKAKFINGELAGTDLAERLRFAHRQSGKVSLDVLGAEVGYSKATLSKVFNGKMAPTWALVRKLSAELKVPQVLVMQEWLPLWIAADTHRRQKPALAREGAGETVDDSLAGTAAAPPGPHSPPGHICSKCGSWVVDVARHTGWHMAKEPGGRPPDAESMGAGWNGESQELTLLREALSSDPEP